MEKLVDIFTHLTDPEIVSRNVEYLVLIIMLNCFLEVIFPPVPGDALLILSGSLAGYAGISPVWVIAGAFTGTFSASLLLYKFGLGMERKMLHSHRFSALLDTKMFNKIEKTLNRYGFALILVSRFIPVIRSGIILAAGIVNLDQRKSIMALAISVLVSTSMYVLGGQMIVHKLKVIQNFLQDHLTVILIGLAITAAVYLFARFIIKRLNTEPKSDNGVGEHGQKNQK